MNPIRSLMKHKERQWRQMARWWLSFANLSLALTVVGASAPAFAASCTSAASGNWTTASTWSNCGGSYPQSASDTATINAHTVTLSASPTISSLTVNSGGTLQQSGTSGRTLTVNGSVTNNGTIVDGSSGSFALVVGGNLTANGTSTTVDTLTVSGTTTANAPLTVNGIFSTSGDLTINSSAAFTVSGTLVFQKSGTQAATFYGTNNNVGNLTINSGSTVSSTNYSNINLRGNLTNNGTLTLPNTAWVFNGSSAQGITGSSDSVLGSLTMNNAAGLTLSRNVTVVGALTLTRGTVTTGSYTLASVAPNCASGALSGGSSTSYVNGNLQLTFPAWSVSCTYPIGDSAAYIPLVVAIPYFSGISGGTLTGSTASGEHPQVVSSGIDPSSDVNRYWTLGASGDTMATLPSAGSYTVTLPFLASEVDTGATVSNFSVALYSGGAWSSLGGSASGTSATYIGGTAFGSYAVGTSMDLTCTAPPNTPSGIAVTCICDKFGRTALSPSTIFGANWVVSSSGTTTFNPTIINKGYLRLTENNGNEATAATVPGIFPASGNYISVEFKHYAYNGSGADGIAVTLSDYATTVVPGAFGGSLGYAQKGYGVSDCTTSTGCPGFSGGWVGVALDEYGNYPNPTEGRINGPGFYAQSVGVRGPGSRMNGYRWLGGSTAVGNIDNHNSSTPSPGYMYQVIVDARNVASNTVPVYVNRDTTTKNGQSYTNLFTGDAYAEANYAKGLGWISKVVPDYWKISFTGSTGGANNIHEIGGLKICAQTVYSPNNPGATANGFSAIDEAYAFPAPTSQWQSYQTGSIYTKLVNVGFKLNIAALTSTGIQTSYVISGSKSVTVKLVDNRDGACVLGSSPPSSSCLAKTAIASQALSFTSSDAGQKQTGNFTLTTAYQNLAVLISDSSTQAVGVDAFSVRPTAVSSVSLNSSPASPFKAGTSNFGLTAVVNASGYNGALKLDNTAINPLNTAGATGVAGLFAPTAFGSAVSGTPSSTQSQATGTFTYSEAGSFTFFGYCPSGSSASVCATPDATSDTKARGVYDGVNSSSECANLTVAACDNLRANTWTGVDSPASQGDCIVDSYSNAKSTDGKYGCNFGIVQNSVSIARFIPDHFAVLDSSLCGGLVGGIAQTRIIGTVAVGSTSLVVKDISCLTAGQTVTIAGAGTAGGALTTTIQAQSVSTSTITINPAVGTAFSEAQVTVAATSPIISYMVQPFGLGVGIEAQNGSGIRTVNYMGNVFTASFVAEDQTTPGSALSTRLSALPSVTCTNGYCSGGSVATLFSRPTPSNLTAQGGPYELLDIGVQATDADGITLASLDMNPSAVGTKLVSGETVDACTTNCTAKRIGQKSKQRMGRLMLENAYGSELLNVRVTVRAQYWNGNSWITHTDDSKTTLPAASFALGNYIAPPSGVTGTAVSSSNMGSSHLPGSSLTLGQGLNTLILTKPNPTAIGSFDVVANLNGGVKNTGGYSCEPVSADSSYTSGTTSAALPWLLGNWCGSNFDKAPSARVKLGASKTSFIYLRERY